MSRRATSNSDTICPEWLAGLEWLALKLAHLAIARQEKHWR
jgi:hypothetical protein